LCIIVIAHISSPLGPNILPCSLFPTLLIKRLFLYLYKPVDRFIVLYILISSCWKIERITIFEMNNEHFSCSFFS
jgi:hypothetical protein